MVNKWCIYNLNSAIDGLVRELPLFLKQLFMTLSMKMISMKSLPFTAGKTSLEPSVGLRNLNFKAASEHLINFAGILLG